MPCQVPSASAPPITGTWSDTPVSMVLTCAGMSSGPSTSWTHWASAGARRSSAPTRSVRTSGSAFSWMTSEADVCRMKMNSAPSFAPVCLMNRIASRVMSVKACPPVSTTSVAVAIVSGATLIMGDNGSLMALPPRRSSGLFQHVLLQRRDHLNQAAPDLLDEIHDLVEIGIVGQLQARLLRLGRRRLGLDGARQRQIARKQLFLDRCVFALKARDLGFERRTLVWHRLAGPSDRAPRADRDLAGAAVKPQIAILDAVEGVAAVVALRRRALRPSRRHCKRKSSDHE